MSGDSGKPMVQNISCVLPENDQFGGLFVGNIYGAQNSEILKQYGIRAIITASIQTKINHNKSEIPFQLKIEAHDKEDYYIAEHINECIEFIERMRAMTNVYVHCYAGVSRSVAIVCAYLMWKYQWTLERALTFLVCKRVVAKPNDGFIKQLQQFQNQIIPSQKIQPPQANHIENHALKSLPKVLQQKTASSNIQDIHSIKNVQNYHNRPISEIKNIPQVQNIAKALKNHNQIPIPKVLVKKEYKNQNATQSNSQYATQPFHQYQKQANSQYSNQSNNQYSSQSNNQYSSQSTKPEIMLQTHTPTQNRRGFNDYLSPEMQPTSPRMGITNHLNSTGKLKVTSQLNNSIKSQNIGFNSSNIPNTNGSGNTFDEYSSVYSTSNGFSSLKKQSTQNIEKQKNTSRCLIRPKDLPGYKRS